MKLIGAIDFEAFSLSAGLRAGFACALPVLVAEYLERPELVWIGTIGFWGCLADPGGAWSTRFTALIGFSLFALIGCALAMLAAGHPAASIAFVLVWSFACAYARCLGAAAASIGLLVNSEMLVTLGTALPGEAVLPRVELTAFGCLWTFTVTLVLWRLHPHGPVRGVLERLYRALGRYAGDLVAVSGAHTDDPAWLGLTSAHRRSIRETLDEARRTLELSRAARLGWSRRNDHLIVLLNEADQIYLGLLALTADLETYGDRGRLDFASAMGRELARIGTHLDGVAGVLSTRGGGTLPRLTISLEAAGDPLELRALSTLRRLADFADGAGQLATGVRPVQTVELPAAEEAEGFFAPAWIILRENLRLDSLSFRHAARLAVTIAAAQAAVEILDLTRGYWLTITALVVLQPYLSAAWRRSFERVAGSMLGGLLAVAIGAVARTPVILSLAIVPLSVLALSARAVNYTIFVFLLTAQFVLTAEMFQHTGIIGPELAALRAADSIGGGVLAVLASFILWPAREAPHLPQLVARAVLAMADWIAASFEIEPRDAETMRRAHARAINNAEISLQRLLTEPGRAGRAAADPAMAILAALRRMGGVTSARMLGPAPADRSEERLAAAWSCMVLRGATSGAVMPDETPVVTADHLRRLTRQSEVIASAARRLLFDEPAIEMPGRVAHDGHQNREPDEERQRSGDQSRGDDQSP